MKLSLWALLLLALCGCQFPDKGQQGEKAKTLAIMTWNLNNLFDGTEQGNEYDEFREFAGWSKEKYTGRLNVIVSAIVRIITVIVSISVVITVIIITSYHREPD